MSSKSIQATGALKVGKRFELELVETSTGLWAARLWFVTRQGRTKNYICSVHLRERARGHILIDFGSRKRGGRRSLGTSDYQEAVTRAERRLSKLGEMLVAQGVVERTLQLAGGDLTIPQLVAVYFSQKNPAKGNIGQHHADNMARMFDIMLELNGPDWTVSQANQEWIDRMIREQMNGVTFSRVDRNPLPARGWNTARDNVGYFMGAVSLAHATPDPNREGRVMQDIDPFARADVTLPKNRAPAPKRPVSIEHHLRLMNPVVINGEHRAAPIDRADPTGVTRLMQAVFFNYGARREQVRVAKRGHLALTPDDVRIMVARFGHSIRNEDARHFVHGAWLFEGADNKMGHLDEEEYTRVLPMSADLRAEVELYLVRNPDVQRAAPESPLFPSPANPQHPVSDSVLFGAPEWRWEVDHDGTPLRDFNGKRIPQQDEHGRWVMKRKAGRYRTAEEFAREDMIDQGIDWTESFPYERGTCVHAWRGHLEVLIEALGYVRSVVSENGDRINLTRHADYLMMRKLTTSVRFRHYIPLDPIILMGLVELEKADEVLARRGIQHVARLQHGLTRLEAGRRSIRVEREGINVELDAA